MTEQKLHITVVDDILDNLTSYEDLLGEFFDLKLIQFPAEVVPFLNEQRTDLLLLDLHMPEINGFELYQQIQDAHFNVPVIFLTGDSSETSVVKGLELGAEDFIVKPVPLQELVARIKNKITTKKKLEAQSVIIYENFKLFLDIQLAEINQQKIQLTPIEFKLIYLFAKNPNKLFNREYIAKQLWPNIHVQNQNIDTHLSNLRKKLTPFSKNLKTIKSRGYILRV